MPTRIWLVVFCAAVVLALLGAGGYLAVTTTTRAWFERDLKLRAELAVEAGRRGLARHWTAAESQELSNVLSDLTHDERIVAAAACDASGTELAATAEFPRDLSCPSHGEGGDASRGPTWTRALEHDLKLMHLSSIPFDGEGGPGRVLLLQDLGFVVKREATARSLLLAALLVFLLGSLLLALFVAHTTWRTWLRTLRRALSGEPSRDFQPVMRDVHDLVRSLALEREGEAREGRWSPSRLRRALRDHLHNERVVVVANREPYIHSRAKTGEIEVQHPASGLVTAVEPIMRACSGVWVAHGSGNADRDTVDARGRTMVPPGEGSYVLRRVWLTAEEERGYYYGFSNEGLWPLCHVAHTRPDFRSEDWKHYRTVNQKFVDAVCQEVDSDDPIILVQDYHFALAPQLLRRRLPRATILTFWHIPWPNAELFGICPWREEILEGLLGSSILGFHTQRHCNQFFDAIDTYVEARIDREENAVVQAGRTTLVRPYPISIEWPVRWLADLPAPDACRRSIRRELGIADDVLLGVGVDRLDYTKGIEERLLAVEALLVRHPEFRGKFSFVQLGAPSRTEIPNYGELNRRIDSLAQRINERWGKGDYRPIYLRRGHHEPPTVFRYLRGCDFCYVSSLHDGMNLVAKEFVAARDDARGVLLLSQFTGAARELTGALAVNPYDIERASDAMAKALKMPAEEQTERMMSMRSIVSEFNVYRWAGRMLIDAAQLRRAERLAGRLAGQVGGFSVQVEARER